MENNKYIVKIAPKAVKDLDEIYKYISGNLYNQDAADKLINKIELKIKRLGIFPFSCELVADDILKDKGYRKLIVENYIVFYLIKDKSVFVMRVLYGAQKYNDLI
ncbi:MULTISPECIES: type II toxin-antitoxin system RelE/ParE family toxin [Oceanobacillus]|uniref:Translation repressor RelE n=1 Tax=Oceanobacillus neutriphilus TaxID=531815 RepID=A0ABQ2NVY9_9BACI|nr:MULTISPECIES: type II toxin-antitoxin system mRNA interferase toxin, RelE/StbE family [Oceanobacillus]GGP11935.1 translation repressor RelE [Oceanobacillus neutriphilus]